jgi:hypothetical protein
VFFLLGERGVAVSIIRVDVGVSGRRAAWWQQTLCGVVERSYYNFSSLASRVYYRFSEGFHPSSFLLSFFFSLPVHTSDRLLCYVKKKKKKKKRARIYTGVTRESSESCRCGCFLLVWFESEAMLA